MSKMLASVLWGLLLAASQAPAQQRQANAAPAEASSTRLSARSRNFSVRGQQFVLEGKPYQIISGEMHYPRIPRAYWRDRLRKARAMGLNTITTYAFWNVHEPRPGEYDFSGQNDLAEFIREAQQEGLNVILRPGPYVCAEWELGGFPAWLLKDRDVLLRSSEPKYNAAVERWLARLAQEVRPLLLQNGGPILAIQVENEYGALGEDPAYLETVKKELIEAGLGASLLFTSNQPADLARGSLPELLTVINFGTGDAEKSFRQLDQLRIGGPRMTGEYWAGWFDKWGEAHHETDGEKEAAELRWMLECSASVSLYMFAGGTTFGWMNGADTHHGDDYHPDTTSYDYDAPLDEQGHPRDKFFLLRKAIVEATHAQPPPLPAEAPVASFAISSTRLSASLWQNLPAPVEAQTPLTFEDLDQNYGYVLYRTALGEGEGGALVLEGLHDYAQVYVDQKLIGVLDRRAGTFTLEIPRQLHASTLDILVENTGRVNYSKVIRTERAGLTGRVTLGGRVPRHWKIYSLPMEDLARLKMLPEPCTGPCFFRTSMQVEKPADTYLDTRGLHKGQMWMGEHNLGRFWSIGPQFTLYAPAPWMRVGENSITFFELKSEGVEPLTTRTGPVFGATTSTREQQ